MSLTAQKTSASTEGGLAPRPAPSRHDRCISQRPSATVETFLLTFNTLPKGVHMRNDLELWRSRELGNPSRELGSFPRLFDRLFNELLGLVPPSAAESAALGFLPNCDVDERDDAYVLSFDLPGMRKEDLDIELAGNTLTVSGERSEESDEGKGRRRHWERVQGKFVRSFTLPETVDVENAHAEYRDGVLRIEVPKSAAANRRSVPIGERSSKAERTLSRGKSTHESKNGSESESRTKTNERKGEPRSAA